MNKPLAITAPVLAALSLTGCAGTVSMDPRLTNCQTVSAHKYLDKSDSENLAACIKVLEKHPDSFSTADY